MGKKCIYIICIVLISSCNSLSDDFFEFLFNSKGISLDRKCSDNPSLFSEGRSFEIYSMSKVDTYLVAQNIFAEKRISRNNKYLRYKIPEWKRTPVINKTDSVYSFIHSEISNDENTCFDESILINILKNEDNYYTFLYDDLGRVKLFIWDTKEEKLFLLTTYEL